MTFAARPAPPRGAPGMPPPPPAPRPFPRPPEPGRSPRRAPDGSSAAAAERGASRWGQRRAPCGAAGPAAPRPAAPPGPLTPRRKPRPGKRLARALSAVPAGRPFPLSPSSRRPGKPPPSFVPRERRPAAAGAKSPGPPGAGTCGLEPPRVGQAEGRWGGSAEKGARSAFRGAHRLPWGVQLCGPPARPMHPPAGISAASMQPVQAGPAAALARPARPWVQAPAGRADAPRCPRPFRVGTRFAKRNRVGIYPV